MVVRGAAGVTSTGCAPLIYTRRASKTIATIRLLWGRWTSRHPWQLPPGGLLNQRGC
jgi:hypothetical protein